MRYFVIMGNTRIGSTWFSSAIHALPGVFCTREIRWRMPFMNQAPPVHVYVDSTTASIKERLEFGLHMAGRDSAIAVGAKLKFDPIGFSPPSAFADLGRILEHDIHVIFLRRSYFEIFQTWKAFGIRHLANPNAKKKLTKKSTPDTGRERERQNRFQSMHSVPLEQKRIFITHDTNEFVRALCNRYRNGDIFYCSISEAIDDLLVLFYNDVFGLSVINGRAADVFGYHDIRANFFDVTQKLGLPVTSEDCINALDNSGTLQIEPPGIKLVFPDDALKEIAGHLDSLFHKIRAGELSTGEVIRCDEAKGTVSFHLPEFVSILAKHEETAGLAGTGALQTSNFLQQAFSRARRVEGSYPRSLRVLHRMLAPRARLSGHSWLAQRPMYVPVRVAPSRAKVPSKKNKIAASELRG